MNKFLQLCRLLFCFLTHRPLQTIYVNFKLLPIKYALRFPIFVYSKTEFRSLSGRLHIRGKVYPNMIHIGDNTRYPSTNRPLSIWTINGDVEFSGRINFYQGTYVYVAETARLDFGTNGTFVGSDCKIICRDHISIGDNVEITWGVQIYDTSFHYIYTDKEANPKKLTKEVCIGNNTWIGNSTTISKGALIPAFSIIASHSLVNTNLAEYGSHCMFAGTPVKLKKQRIDRVWDYSLEKELDKMYGYIRYKL